MTQEMLFSKYAEQYPLTVPQEAVENELQLLILEEKQRIQYETLTGFAVHLSPQEELNKKMPSVGDIISTVDGTGEILSTNVLMQTVKAAVRKKENDPPTIDFYPVDEIKVIKAKKRKKHEEEPLDTSLDD